MIDIIIPVYNSGKTICKTLNSILEQDNKDDIVVYIIDDASTEEYDEVISFYSKYINIKYLKLDKNSGPGVARQYGIDHSSNEYIIFIDSDDIFYDNDSVLKLYNSIYDHDMVYAKMLEKRYDINEEIFHDGCLHGKMYRRSFINDNNIRFNEYRSHEDNAFNQLYLALSQNVNYLDEVVYIYNFNKESITSTTNRNDSLKLYIESMNWLFKEIEKRNNVNLYKVGLTAMNVMCYCYFNYLLDEKNNDFIISDSKFIKEMYKKYIDNIDDADKLEMFKSFDYPVIPSITLNDFINKI